MNETNRNGSICISDEVICDIAVKAAREVDGVVNVYQRILDGARNLVNRKESMNKGVSVRAENGGIVITVQISVLFGAKIPEVCANVQEAVAEAVADMTGITVNAVNVSVIGIAVEKSVLKKSAD